MCVFGPVKERDVLGREMGMEGMAPAGMEIMTLVYKALHTSALSRVHLLIVASDADTMQTS